MDKLKVCFIWVRSFRNFNNAGINLSSTHKFYYDSIINKLTFDKVSPLPKDFFGKSITEVTALIGKNGSGKSNALELICKILKEGNTTISQDFLIVAEVKGKFKCYHNFLNSVNEVNGIIEFEEYDGSIDPLKIIYFSNVYDQRINNFSTQVSDISSNTRLPKRSYYISRGRKTDFEYQLNFITSGFYSLLEVAPPERILISSNVWARRFNSSQRRDVFGQNEQKFQQFESDFRKRLRGLVEQSRLYYLIIFAFLKETISNLSHINFNKDIDTSKIVGEFLNNLYDYDIRSTNDIAQNMLICLDSLTDNFSFLQDITKKNESKRFKNQLEVLHILKNEIFNLDIRFETEGQRGKITELFSFNFDERADKVLRSLAILDNSMYFNVDWLGISSGHKAYLNLFSLIYEEVRRIKRNNLLLCIDEGDLYLHPKWQIEFFSKLLNVLPDIYDGNIQLILTSHSPFLLSDIPKQCLTILDKNFESCTMDGVSLEKETFAGNIYDLYESPFFLGNQKKSVFSTKKIKQTIEALDKNSLSIDNDDIDKLIELIGDDVIRFHLKKRRNND
ncbi:AAA family ATPase [Confluentibacter sediminis]|uniref:AAA family ATPase n=1 Tax=Confluentibacter sediminis TaxID=2219045 RepID=UPI000DAC0745|nr:AAA family ATPase [Confluentibacter sediminis]